MNLRRVLIIANLDKDGAEKLAKGIEDYLSAKGIGVVLHAFRGKSIQPEIDDVDLAVTVGGDGTVLFSARILFPRNIPILAINLGTFGFIAEVPVEGWMEVLEDCVRDGVAVSHRMLLDVGVERNGKRIVRTTGLNDAVITSTGISKLVRLEATLTRGELGHYMADGIIIATPTGSTAYSVAAGGPILDPEMDAMIINPICPFTLSNRPIVVPGSEEVRIRLEPVQRTAAILTVDGQSVFPLEPNDVIVCRKARKKVALVRPRRGNFYDVLRKKLNWSGGF